MSGQNSDTAGPPIPFAPKATNAADVVESAGQAILGLIHRAADTTEANFLQARDVAAKLADQLRDAQNRIRELEADARYYQDRADRAEKWLYQIAAEIERRFTSMDAGRHAEPARPFVRIGGRKA